MVYRALYSYRQRIRVVTLFPNIFFVLFLYVHLQKFLKRKSEALVKRRVIVDDS